MNQVIKQATTPEIRCFDSNSFPSKCYQVFSTYSQKFSGKNLQSYNFSRSIDNMVGTFTFTIKEDVKSDSKNSYFMDKVKELDVIKIYENGGNLDQAAFIGVITSISINGMASNESKMITISGKSIEFLFDMYRISTDKTAMSLEQDKKDSLDLIVSLSRKQGEEAIKISSVFETVYEKFNSVATGIAKNVSATKIKELIDNYFGTSTADFIDCKNPSGEEIEFNYPISSNMFNNSTIKIFDFLRNLLPEAAYEIYGYVDGKQPKIKIREKPFDSDDWKKLSEKGYKIDPIVVTDYTFTKSNDEIYTYFIPYLEGSQVSPEFSQAINNARNNIVSQSNPEKARLYGYRPLIVNFVGYNIAADIDDDKKSSDTSTVKTTVTAGKTTSNKTPLGGLTTSQWIEKKFAENPGITDAELGQLYEKESFGKWSSSGVVYQAALKKYHKEHEAQEPKTDPNSSQAKTAAKLTKLAKRMINWYGNLEDMYNGDITIVNIVGNENYKAAGIGDVVKLCQGEFYVTSEKHTWRYGDNPMINYTVSRGGKYTNGEFEALNGLSKPFAELIGYGLA